MRFFLSKQIPPFDRVVLVESGSRQLLEDLLPGLYELYGEAMQLDIVTCYQGAPAAFLPERGRIFRIGDYGPAGRQALVAELKARRPSICGIICSAEPIMTKWKWLLALTATGKLFLLNENGDYFWVDRGHLDVLAHFALFRLGLAGAGAVMTIGRILLFPISLVYLLGFAGWVHWQRLQNRKARA